MKLELNHLAPYLPYGLRLFHAEYKAKHILDISIKEGFYGSEMSAVTLTAMINVNEYLKPILRPLSSLTDDQMKYLEERHGKMIDGYEECKTHFMERTNDLPYSVIQSLLELHCDLFGLIESGLAIDINTLNK